jgi:hypothetical protein
MNIFDLFLKIGALCGRKKLIENISKLSGNSLWNK